MFPQALSTGCRRNFGGFFLGIFRRLGGWGRDGGIVAGGKEWLAVVSVGGYQGEILAGAGRRVQAPGGGGGWGVSGAYSGCYVDCFS